MEKVRTPWRTLRNSGSACARSSRSGLLQPAGVLGLILLLAACGSDSDGGQPSAEASFSTIAYTVTRCQGDAQRASGSQKLVIQQEGREGTVKEWQFPPLPAPGSQGLGLCHGYGLARYGASDVFGYPVQRFAVSPDGSAVVFEVTDDHSILLPGAPDGLVAAEDEGFFVVNADGTGLRRLGEASREPCWRFGPTPDSFTGTGGPTQCWRLWFSPDGRKVAFTDIGPDETGQEGPQVFTMDLATGARTQVTRLAPLVPPGPLVLSLRVGSWTKDGTTLRFSTNTETDGYLSWSVRADGTEEPEKVQVREKPEPLPGATLESIPRITDAATNVIRRGSDGVSELWVVSQEDPLNPSSVEEELQLTSFGRPDTGVSGYFLDVEQQTVLFFASADPFGTNPTQNCQLFGIDTLGGNLRQVTRWNQTQRLPAGCTGTPQPAPDCYIVGFEVDRRAGPDTLLFSTSCDPLGTNPLTDNLYAVRTDGTGLRQLTHSRGLSLHDDGSVTVELTGNWAASR